MADIDYDNAGGKPYYKPAPLDVDFINNIKTKVVTDLELLKQICSQTGKNVAVDTETDGLNYFNNKIVGFSVSFNSTSGFYVPVRHVNEDGSLADYNISVDDAIPLLHKLLMNNKILLYNSCFDLTMIGQEFPNYGIQFTDIEKVKFVDVLNLVYFLEPEVKKNGLKWAARHFLGRIAPEFEQITGISRKSKTVSHFGCINPWVTKEITMAPIELKGAKKSLTDLDILHNQDCELIKSYTASAGIYACADSLNTYALFEKLMPVCEKLAKSHKSNGNKPLSLATDNKLAKAMLHYKHTPICLDAKLMKKYLKDTENRLEEVQKEIYETAGTVFNINSVAQKRAIFQQLGINTGIETATGMSVSKDAIKGIDHPIIKLMLEYATLQKRKSAYFEPLSKSEIGRINYKTTSLATGRLASGASGTEAGNSYFSSISVQTLPKAKNQMYAVVKSDSEKSILGYEYIPADSKYQEEHPDATYVEGFNQEGNIRNCLCGPHRIYVDIEGTTYDFGYDVLLAEKYLRSRGLSTDCIRCEKSDEWLICSTDFSAEELCVIGNLSSEPSFVKPLLEGADLHRSMASIMFADKGFSDMDKAKQKDYRKKAKSANFGLCYRGSYRALLRDITDEEEAKQVYDKWWSAMPIYKAWQDDKIEEMLYQTDGDAINIYGRRRRFKPMLETGNKSIVNSAIRGACNHFVQSTAADLMRIIMSDFYDKYLKSNANYNEIRLLASIHDELAFAIKKDVLEKWVYRICDCMESAVPTDWVIPLKAVPGIGTSLGNIFDYEFDRDENRKIIEGTLHPKI